LEDEAFFHQLKTTPAALKKKRPDPSPIERLQKITTTGIRLDDDALYEPATTTHLDNNSGNNNNSSTTTTATVMAVATGYDLRVYQRFVGSLRKTGYQGHIILGVSPNVSPPIIRYLRSRNVTIHKLQWVNCTYSIFNEAKKADILERSHCAHPYPDIKVRWSRFPMARDWLLACPTCTGPVLFTDARDTVFQRDPFTDQVVTGLFVFQEHVNMTTDNWLTQWPIQQCKDVDYSGRPMLCSGTTVGTRAAMIKYLEIMYKEMKVWTEQENCRFEMDGDDQSIHNYLYYSGQLPFATSIANRAGGIVNTVGHVASQLANAHFAHWKKTKQLEKWDAKLIPYDGATNTSWIGSAYQLTNDMGLLTEHDGSISRVIQQFDRFHHMYETWLDRQPWSSDQEMILVVS
jgi:hypothetical protein